MNSIGYMVSYIIAILGVAFPLLLKMISEVSDKYGTLLIIKRFRSEPVFKWFVRFLISSIVVSILWILNLQPPKIDIIENILSDSAGRLLLISASITIIFFFRLVFLILTYYDPLKVAKRLLATENTTKQIVSSRKMDESLKIVTSIITTYIALGSEDIVAELIKLFSKTIQRSQTNPNKEEYEKIYYDLTDKIFQAMLNRNDRVFANEIMSILDNAWFPQHGVAALVSHESLFHTWFNLVELINRDKLSLFMGYWKIADVKIRDYIYNHDLPDNVLSDGGIDVLFPYWLSVICSDSQQAAFVNVVSSADVLPEYLESYTNPHNNNLLSILNYVSFHTNLGGLLLYLRKYEAIRRMLSYTSSLPPKYHLLPDTFTEVFRLYLLTHDRLSIYYSLTPVTFIFPDLEGIDQDEITRGYICRYIALLYIRLYTLFPKYSGTYHYDPPSLPDDKYLLNAWKLSAESITRRVPMLLDDKEIMQSIGFDSIIGSDRVIITNNLTSFTKSIEDRINQIATNYTPSPEQGTGFSKQLTDSISISIDKLMLINNKENIDKDYSSWHTLGDNRLIGKNDFQEHPQNTELITTPLICGIQSKLYQSFYAQTVTMYLVSKEDLFPAVNKLKADPNQYVLIGFNIHTDYYTKVLKVKNLTESEFQGFELFLYNVSSRRSSISLFLVRKCDLPSFIFHKSEDENMDKYSLREYHSNYKLSSSLLDLNTENIIKDELQSTCSGIELEKCMLACVDYHIEIRWKNNPHMIHLQVYNRNMNLGIPVELKDIDSI